MSSKVISCIYDLLDLQESGRWRDDGTIVLKRPPASSKLERIKFRSFSANILPTITNSSIPTIYAELKAHIYGLNDDSTDYVTDQLPTDITINTLQGSTTYKVDEGSVLLSSFTTTINNTIEESIANALITSKATLANLLAFKQDDYYRWSTPIYGYMYDGVGQYIWSPSPDQPEGFTKTLPLYGKTMYDASTIDKGSSLDGMAMVNDPSMTQRLSSFTIDPLPPTGTDYAYSFICLVRGKGEQVIFRDTSQNTIGINLPTFQSFSVQFTDSSEYENNFMCEVSSRSSLKLINSTCTWDYTVPAGFTVKFDETPTEYTITPTSDKYNYTYWLDAIGLNKQNGYYSFLLFYIRNREEWTPANTWLANNIFSCITSVDDTEESDLFIQPMTAEASVISLKQVLMDLKARVGGLTKGYFYGGLKYQYVDTEDNTYFIFRWYGVKDGLPVLAYSCLVYNAFNTERQTLLTTGVSFDYVVNIDYNPNYYLNSWYYNGFMNHRATLQYNHNNNMDFYVKDGVTYSLEWYYNNGMHFIAHDHRVPCSSFDYATYTEPNERNYITISLDQFTTILGKKQAPTLMYKLEDPNDFILTGVVGSLKRTANLLDDVAAFFGGRDYPYAWQSNGSLDLYRTYTKDIIVGSSSVGSSFDSRLQPFVSKHAYFGTQNTVTVDKLKFDDAFTFNADTNTYMTYLMRTNDGKYVIEFYTSIYTDPDVFDFSVDYANSSLYDSSGKPFVNSLSWGSGSRDANASYDIDTSVNNLNPQLLSNLNVYLALRNTDLTLKLVSNDYPTLNNIVFYLNETAMIDFKEASCSPNESVLECRIIDSKGNLLVPSDAALLYANIVVAVDWQFY